MSTTDHPNEEESWLSVRTGRDSQEVAIGEEVLGLTKIDAVLSLVGLTLGFIEFERLMHVPFVFSRGNRYTLSALSAISVGQAWTG